VQRGAARSVRTAHEGQTVICATHDARLVEVADASVNLGSRDRTCV
jgi:ABC-type lipoprotein export system ATPase subunit